MKVSQHCSLLLADKIRGCQHKLAAVTELSLTYWMTYVYAEEDVCLTKSLLNHISKENIDLLRLAFCCLQVSV